MVAFCRSLHDRIPLCRGHRFSNAFGAIWLYGIPGAIVTADHAYDIAEAEMHHQWKRSE